MEFVINYWAVLVCGVASMVLGMLWYGTLFRKPWAQDMGYDQNGDSTMHQPGMLTYLAAFIGALVMAYVFTHVLQAFESDSIGMALQGALWTWLGFMATVKLGDKLWGKATTRLFLIESGYYLVQLAVFAIILQSWPA